MNRRPHAPRPADPNALLRRQISASLEAALDAVDRLVLLLDALDGDPDAEDDGTAEPPLAALVDEGAQLRWAGFDDVGRAA